MPVVEPIRPLDVKIQPIMESSTILVDIYGHVVVGLVVLVPTNNKSKLNHTESLLGVCVCVCVSLFNVREDHVIKSRVLKAP